MAVEAASGASGAGAFGAAVNEQRDTQGSLAALLALNRGDARVRTKARQEVRRSRRILRLFNRLLWRPLFDFAARRLALN